jgi:hypothetical protein
MPEGRERDPVVFQQRGKERARLDVPKTRGRGMDR